MQATSASTVRTARGTWPVAAIAVLVAVLVFGPALVATTVTARQQPGSFVTQPWRGWGLLASVLRSAPGAELPSPGAALERARTTWRDADGLEPTRARLVYLPGNEPLEVERVSDGAPAARTDIRPAAGNSLAWIVEGTDERSGTRGERVLGVLDYSSGEVRYDAREREEEAAT